MYPAGHFYSPLVDNDAVLRVQDRIWPESPVVLGIDMHDDDHRTLLAEEFPKYVSLFSYPRLRQECRAGFDYYLNNDQYAGLDALTLFCFLQLFKPKKMIEVGCGYSTLLSADVNRRFFHGMIDIICVEPYPAEFLKLGVPGVSEFFKQKVEETPVELFASLEAGDFLFIDTSHVAKTGSDVNYIYFEILPRLKAGVIVHLHDIFLPEDYPKKWVIDEGRGWNEQYVVRALLMFSTAFSVLFGCHNAYLKYPSLVKQLFNGVAYGGGSLWIRKMQ